MLKNIIANFIGRFWSILSNFLFIPLYINILGFESYSIISFTLVIAGVMGILDAGLTATLSREFARADVGDNEKIKIYRTLESTYFIIVSICIILILMLSNLIANNWLKIENFDTDKIKLFIKIISFDVGFSLLFRFYMGGLLGLEKQVKANVYQVAWGVIRNGLVVIAIYYKPELIVFFFWQASATVFFTIILKVALEKEIFGKLVFNLNPKFDFNVYKKIWKFALGMLLISLVAALNTQMDKLAISKLLPIEELGYYTLSVSLAMGLMVMVNPISVTVLPRFTLLYSQNDVESASYLYHRGSILVAILVFSVMSCMVFFSEELVWIWTGDWKIAHNSSVFLPIIAFSFSMLAMQVIPFNIAISNGYTLLNNILGLISLLITIPGYFIAIKISGAIGAAILFCFIQIITTYIYLFYINKKFIKSSLVIIYFRNLILPLIISLIIAYTFSVVVGSISTNRVTAFLLIGGVALLTILFNAIIILSKKDMLSLMNLIKGRKSV